MISFWNTFALYETQTAFAEFGLGVASEAKGIIKYLFWKFWANLSKVKVVLSGRKCLSALLVATTIATGAICLYLGWF